MGDPKKPRKKYKNPTKHWEAIRIKEEIKLIKEFGLKRKKEIWKIQGKVRKFRQQAKKLIGVQTVQSKKEQKQLLDKLYNLSLIDKNAKLYDVLDLDIKKLMERRLQSLVFRKKLALTAKQARQLIIHGHIYIDKKKLNTPSYIVKREEEDKINSDQKLIQPKPEVKTEIKKETETVEN